MELGKAYLELATSTRGLAPGIRKEFGAIEREMNVSGGKAGKEFSKGFGKRSMLGKVMDGALMGVGMGAVTKLAGAAKGVFDVAIGGGFNRAVNIEQAKSKLDGLGHSAESVKSIMDNASAAVRGTAFGLGDAAAVAASTVAAGVKPGAALERTLKLVGDAATIAGADMGEMGAVFNKVAASNKLQMDSVNQLQDRGIPVLQLVAKEMGVTQEEAAKLASEGKVSFETFQDAMEEGMGGAALNSGKTFAGAMANTKAALGRIGESFLTPLMGTIGSLAQAAIPVIDSIGAMLKPVAEQFGSWLEKQTPRITAFLEKVPGYLQAASEKVSALWALVKDSAVGDYIQTLWESAHSLGGTLRDNLAPVFETVVALVTEKVLPFFQRLGEIVMSVLGPAFSTVVGLVRDHVIPVLGTIAEFVYGRLIPAIYDFGNNILLPIFNDVAAFVRDKFLPVFSSFVAFITDNVVPVVKDFADRVLIPAFEMIGGAMKWWWDTIGWPIFNTLWDVITNLVGPALSWLWESAFKPAFTKMGDAMDTFSRNWSGVWNGIRAAAAKPVNFIIETVWNDGLRKALNLIPGVNLPEARGITVPSGNARSGGGRKALTAFATGGYVDLPWSAVNRDPYLGVTAQGGAFRFEGEEFIVNRDATRKHRELLEAINADRLPGYATGGAVRPVPQGHSGWKGGYYRSGKYHGGLDFPAPTGTAIRAMWDGVVTKALRLNRSYGHHAQISHGGLSTLYAHMSRLIVSAGQRIARGQTIGYVGSTGNSTGPHLHLEVRRGGTRLNPEPYLSGAARMSGGDMAPDAVGEDPAIMNAIDKLPAMFKKVRDSLGELTGPWGSLFKQGVTDAVKTAADWALGKIPGLGDLLAFITGKKRDGYASGTLSASPGWSWVGERGPELVHFRGGERVLSHQDSMRATQPSPTLVRVELVDERMRGLIRAEVRQMQREGLVYA